MRREDFSFNSEDGLEIAYYRWRAPGKAAAIVQIAHGMGEHSLRYAHVAEFLNQTGFHVYANDHRGHGRSVKGRESLGDFGDGGWNGLVADMVTLTRSRARAKVVCRWSCSATAWVRSRRSSTCSTTAR